MDTPSASFERMSRVDYAWLRMDNDANQMMIVGVWLLRPTLGIEELRERVSQSLLAYRRFRQRVSEDAMGARWVDVNVDINQHVVSQTLRPRPGQSMVDSLKDCVADLATWPLSRKHPLWQFHLVEDMGDGSSAMIARIHHCIGDGIALISVMLSLADGGAAPPVRPRKADASPHAQQDNPRAASMMASMANFSRRAASMYGAGVAASAQALTQAGGDVAQAVAGSQAARLAAKVTTQVLTDVKSFLAMQDDSPTRLKGKATPGKTVAWCDPLPLEDVKMVGRVLGVTVNDVLMSCVAGAVGNYLRSKGDDTQGQAIRTMVPVNLRPLEKAYQLGNKFGLVPLELPIGIEHPVKRLYDVHERMHSLKASYQPLLAFGVLAVSGLLVKPLQDRMMSVYAKKATAVMTNVPGPKDKIGFCGRSVDQVMFWVPQSGDIGMGVSILSYAGGVQLGLITDTGMCPDPQGIVDGFKPEFDKLLVLVLMAPWGKD
jgi:diacylglycerol O-acyltransferase / wax synthase